MTAANEGIERIKKLYAERESSAVVTPEIAFDDRRHIIDVEFRGKEMAM